LSVTATRPTKARKPVQPAIAQFSPAAAKLIEQIQADARAQLLAELSAKDAITVLHGFDADTKHVYTDGTHITVGDAKGNEISMYRHRTEPEMWRGKSHMAGYWHPALWYGTQTLVDANGTKWRREIERHVCDDFGNLVEVPA